MTLCDGSPDNYLHRLVLPSILVAAGDFIVIHSVTTSETAEVNETASKSKSGYPQASAGAYDL